LKPINIKTQIAKIETIAINSDLIKVNNLDNILNQLSSLIPEPGFVAFIKPSFISFAFTTQVL
jgi:hypothetical protein